ncbi:hypothetical protein ElyMa_004322300 [Elysia marginata]|uniref:Uncharacterized protein n=1 Tax=Elysia marginata TaxID=1093978 RepID=A0AAV4H0G5_9GAST|nr:hypothetical protein ElyMa_004322300 [Elysia marginata]
MDRLAKEKEMDRLAKKNEVDRLAKEKEMELQTKLDLELANRDKQADSTETMNADVDYEMFKKEQQKYRALDDTRALDYQDKGFIMCNG